jgi:hypothetical protein
MCHWVREQDRRRDIAGGELPAKPAFSRPRVAGAVAVALVALTAGAALPLGTSTPPVSVEQKAAVTTVAARSTEPAGAVIEQTAATIDDGVPSTPRAGGPCDHGM